MEIYYNIENWGETGFITLVDPSIPQKKKGVTVREYTCEMDYKARDVVHLSMETVTFSRKLKLPKARIRF